MTSATKLRSSNLRSNWLRRSFLFAFITQVVTVISVDDTADYPRGCRGGPVTVDGVDYTSMVLPEGSCAYTMKGHDADGTYRESVGVELVSNAPGQIAKMRLQMNVRGNPGSFDTPAISVETTDAVHLENEVDGVTFRWFSQPGFQTYSPSDDGYIRVFIGTNFFASTPRERAFTGRYSIAGAVNSDGMNLYAAQEGDALSTMGLSVVQKVSFSRVIGGWRFHIGYRAVGNYTSAQGTLESYNASVDVVKGILYG
ncbi:hypothetical protein FOZ62_009542 [Perkinsus olseni]|uniref:Uncharacterized protein n=1 Tax=Perkinsus olseni TaxID=32597 RepID=A0A7J6TK14_PEROL|nr:hypothetical protein FOZ62_009542 [Perkinsus olseni]